MDRCVVFVDAGYLGESAKALLTESGSGRKVRADRPALVEALADLAVKDTGLPLLRVYWYDAAPNRVPFPDQRELGRLPDVKLRLGNLRERDGGRRAQKGVDADLHADMTELARNKAASDFVLLTGDEDLLRAVEEVQKYGVRLHLWGVDSPPESSNQSLELIMAADRRRVLDATLLRSLFTVLPAPGEVAAGVAEVAAATERLHEAEEAPAPQQVEPTHPPSDHVPTPAEVAAMHKPSTPQKPEHSRLLFTSSGRRSGYVHGPDEDRLLRLSDISTREERARDESEDRATGSPVSAFEAGHTYGVRWRDRATDEMQAGILASKPLIPRRIDAELLGYADARGADTWHDEQAKHQVRDGFWAALMETST
ncbi:MAG TPA: NYN domain-containing protein [Actinomycetes bacterium]|nr:NYN domain-containing protein [Actinomycetes bacterium]